MRIKTSPIRIPQSAFPILSMSRRYLFLTVFMGGMTTLAIEFTTSRMLQTVYGTSNIVWANVIGLVLLFLTTGYFVGGRWADRNPSPHLFYSLVTAAGGSSIFFLLLTSVILKSASAALATFDVGAVAGSLVGVIIALAVPITLLGCLSPFAIRLGVRDVAEAGAISGQIYAISTLGSLLGTYLPTLFIIPLAGTRATAVIFGTILLVVGLIGLWQVGRKTAATATVASLFLIPFVAWGLAGTLKTAEGQIFETESGYNYIQVVERGGCTYLLLNEGQAYHSYYCAAGQPERVSVWSMMLAAPYFYAEPPQVSRMAVIGLAAGTIPKLYLQAYPEAHVDGIEIDGAIIQAGYDFFALRDERIQTIVGDGRYELNQLTGNYEVITIDAYKVPYIPWHLTTVEFFEEVRRQLTADGVVAINVGRAPNDRRLVEALTATLQQVFPSVHTVDVPGTLNTILFATVQPTSAADLATHTPTHPLVAQVVGAAVSSLQPTTAGDGVLFTDNRAPVETIVDSLVMRYLLQEGLAGLPSVNEQ